MRNLRQ